MATTGQRLVELSGLPTGTAGAHLVAMSTAGTTAAQRLLSRSPLSSATAIEHLASATTGGGGSVPLGGFIVNMGRLMGR
jgi:hypothetical protein